MWIGDCLWYCRDVERDGSRAKVVRVSAHGVSKWRKRPSPQKCPLKTHSETPKITFKKCTLHATPTTTDTTTTTTTTDNVTTTTAIDDATTTTTAAAWNCSLLIGKRHVSNVLEVVMVVCAVVAVVTVFFLF